MKPAPYSSQLSKGSLLKNASFFQDQDAIHAFEVNQPVGQH